MAIIGIVAMDQNRAIGKDNKLLCNLPKDMEHFRETTEDSIVVMGRKTWASIGKPLPNRVNIILTRDKDHPIPKCINCHVMYSVKEVMEFYFKSNKDMYIIGGSQIYSLFHHFCSKFIVTHIDYAFDGADTFFPELDWTDWTDLIVETVDANADNPYGFDIVSYERYKV